MKKFLLSAFAVFGIVNFAFAQDTVEDPEPLVVSTPVMTPDGGAVLPGSTVTITCEEADATIYYTTDGTEPSTESAVYSDPVTINEITVIKAFAVCEGYTDSAVASYLFTIVDENAETVEFLFNNQEFLTTFFAGEDPKDLFTNDTDGKMPVQNKSFTYEGVKITFSPKGNGGVTTNPRFYNNGTTIDLRIYIDQWFSVELDDTDSYISEITLRKHNGGDPFCLDIQSAESTKYNPAQTIGSIVETKYQAVWTPGDDAKDSAVKVFNASPDYDGRITSRITRLCVSIKSKSDAVTHIAADDAFSPVEYYNLQGMRVNNPVSGQLLIRRQGHTVAKSFIR